MDRDDATDQVNGPGPKEEFNEGAPDAGMISGHDDTGFNKKSFME